MKLTLNELRRRVLELEADFARYATEREDLPPQRLDLLTEVAHDLDSLSWKMERLEGSARPDPQCGQVS
jgi:hypothetical protein